MPKEIDPRARTHNEGRLRFLSNGGGLYEYGPEWFQVSQGISQQIVNGEITATDGIGILQATDTLRETYPGFTVPPGFRQARPSILFATPYLTGFEREMHTFESEGSRLNENFEVFFQLSRSAIKDLIITNPKELQYAWEVALSVLRTHNISPTRQKEALTALTRFTFLRNLELYRLTADPQGSVMRFSSTPTETLEPSKIKPNHASGALATFTQPLRERAHGKYLTFWFRTDNGDKEGYMGATTPIYATLDQLETNNLIMLDHEECNALAVISKDPYHGGKAFDFLDTQE